MTVVSERPGFSAPVLVGFLTPRQLASQLGVSERTLARMHASRRGPPRCALGKLILYREQTVREWLASLESEPVRRHGRR
jgi:hypothetical protein